MASAGNLISICNTAMTFFNNLKLLYAFGEKKISQRKATFYYSYFRRSFFERLGRPHKTWSIQFPFISIKDTRNCPEKAMKISHFNPNQSAPSIYIMIELYYFSLDQWEIRIHLLWGKSFNIPLHCDPHLNQTKWLIFNDLLPLTIPGVLGNPHLLLLESKLPLW